MLRCGCLPLEVETGRYRTPKTPLLQRNCEICAKGIGDEIHFLNYCQPLTTLRLQLYKVASDACDFNFYALLPEQKNLQLLHLCAENSAVKDLIYDMFILRRSLLERWPQNIVWIYLRILPPTVNQICISISLYVSCILIFTLSWLPLTPLPLFSLPICLPPPQKIILQPTYPSQTTSAYNIMYSQAQPLPPLRISSLLVFRLTSAVTAVSHHACQYCWRVIHKW